MNFLELQNEIAKYLHTEDSGMIRIALASVIATRMKLGDPVWLILIGPSSSGKSQVLRPLALTDKKFLHRVDDISENTLISGMRGGDMSLLSRIGALGIIVISDFTVLFSKSPEARAAILAQLRMVYDGEMVKYFGNQDKATTWKGSLGILAGSTPSIYTHFEEVADMGERFIYYRMKPYNTERATRLSLSRTIYGKELDQTLAGLYDGYVRNSIQKAGPEGVPPISLGTYERIVRVSLFAALLRTPTHYDRFAKAIDKVPVPEMPMRIALQLSAIARGLSVMQHADTGEWELGEEDLGYLEWCAYSLANEERRACLRVLARQEFGDKLQSQTIADEIGLTTSVISMNLQHLAAIGILERRGESNSLVWMIKGKETWTIVRKLEGIKESVSHETERMISGEEASEGEAVADALFDQVF